MSNDQTNPLNLVYFGPDANCTYALCDPSQSVYRYRPSPGANITFTILFGLALLIHLALGFKWRAWSFTGCILAGCADEILGYVGRILLFNNVWNFNSFMIQIVCITTAPIFFCAAIYVLLARTIAAFGKQYSRFKPALFYWVFVPCDIVSLALQGAGGALSTNSSGENPLGVNISLAGLAFQVFTLAVFSVLYLDYLWRFYRSGGAASLQGLGISRSRLRLFFGFVTLSIVCILARCIFRVDELSQGYSGPLVAEESLFIGLEGVLIVVSVFALCIGHPGIVFDNKRHKTTNLEAGVDQRPAKTESGNVSDL